MELLILSKKNYEKRVDLIEPGRGLILKEHDTYQS